MGGSFACPTCRRPIAWTEAFPWRPFCSERCRLVDFGAWLTGGRSVPGEPADPAEMSHAEGAGAGPDRSAD